MNIVFRVDAAIHIGSGHVMRCLTLADELTRQGATCLFICRAFDGHLFSLINEKGYKLFTLPASNVKLDRADAQIVPHEHWLGADYSTDAEQTIAIFNKIDIDIDWLIVDHYAIDIRWESMLRPYTKKIMLIDDLADRQHDCDLLLDQNYFENFENRYNKKVSKNTDKLLGPTFALLNSRFLSVRSQKINHKFTMKNILVYFGGADRTGETVKFLQALKQLGQLNDIEFHILIGITNKDKSLILNQVSEQKNLKFYEFIHDMPSFMGNMDYTFGACGTTNWERMCLGLNSSIVAIAENQIEISHFLSRKGLIEYLGYTDTVTESDYIQSLLLLNSPSNLQKLEKRKDEIMKLVDGYGVMRVVSILRGN